MCHGEPCEAYIDGASSGNPGPSAYGYVIKCGQTVVRGSGYLGRGTNNLAEYQALLHCMRRAQRMGCKSLTVFSDSTLVVKQMLGEYEVREPRLKRLRDEALKLSAGFQPFEIKYISRNMNSEANNLARRALTGVKKRERE